ncbi:MAG: hypothetical protein OEL56_01235 [Nitrosopumilus sp.]|nr:hypothetical protein [Nitrosopumilus sp.]MDH3515264.1 hypothetical protein [Nitrosopumilus sp.]MDH3564435.1 hypothetical protein [Nitrosopumilus sp.]MDH5418139.1 hypothetical protein [Nitrosopumilus sp.]MDH5554356.1 hypothetical protein [Nitrosopumilus sp.]
MTELSLEDIEFIKILSNSDASILQMGMNDATKKKLDEQIGVILRAYYRENTMNMGKELTKKFLKAGITEDDGKSAIACARRLGIDIS